MANNSEGFEEFLRNSQQSLISESDNTGGSDIKSSGLFLESITNHSTGKQASIGGKRSQNSSSKNPSIEVVVGLPRDAQSGGGELEIHLTTEIQRRKKMRDLISFLGELLPQLHPKADQFAILDEALNYIPILEQTVQQLESQKLERIKGEELPTAEIWSAGKTSSAGSVSRFPVCFETWSTPNVVLNITGEEANISISTAKKPGLLTAIFCVLEKHGLELVFAEESSNSVRSMYMINARATVDSDQFPGAMMIAEIFKLAVNEILLLISG